MYGIPLWYLGCNGLTSNNYLNNFFDNVTVLS
jgi:hypothetical protein